MIGLGAIGSILLGICVIAGLMKEGEMGCFGGLLILLLVLVLVVALGFAALIGLGGMM